MKTPLLKLSIFLTVILIAKCKVVQFGPLALIGAYFSLTGQWKVQTIMDRPKGSTNTDQLKLISKKGKCDVFFIQTSFITWFETDNKHDSVVFRFRDPNYMDGHIIMLQTQLRNYNSDDNIWQVQNQSANYTSYTNLINISTSPIKLSYSIGKQTTNLTLPFQFFSLTYSKPIIPISICIICFGYNLVVLAISIYFLCYQLIRSSMLSTLTLCHFIYTHICMALLSFVIGMLQFPSLFLLTGLIQLIIALSFFISYNNLLMDTISANIQKYFFSIYILILISYFYLKKFAYFDCLWLIPQIAYSFWTNNKFGKRYAYLFLMVSSKAYWLYIYGYEDNVFGLEPDYLFCTIVVVLILAQIAIIQAQNKYGPLFFFKKQWMPNYYQYYKTFTIDSTHQLYYDACSICLMPFAPIVNKIKKPQEKSQNYQRQITQLTSIHQVNVQKISITLMITPCNHKFHPFCLQRWLMVASTCPIDRSALPHLYT